MSLVIILYLAVLAVFTLGYLYKGGCLLKNKNDGLSNKRTRFILKAQEDDEVDYVKFRKHNGRLSIVIGFLYLALIAITFLFAPNVFGTLTTREIQLIRTCIIAVLVLHFSRDMWLATIRDKFVIRKTNTEITRYDIKTAVAFVVLSVTLIYSIYIQISYAW
ncbi:MULTISPECIES: hypothetical protein [unclassified Oceanispirochaeta]|uniref:hypothetical protein n=1 Tax=unclassified Oceanispirochaeta TaxID=2635722 RepID=UPI000E0913EE|nr:MULTISPECIES: hypothetical protein [unclassified Oceanispirochaeta]MBF9016870.1 hypothetical protein [Oceanispirochaeta sp. M2]NPD73233.1 hypothetical protein [Oceanispirochaeta sp. M1]RDG31099.1 hypothetical protein DV872_14120 [Oceanispirochaeta sp. M1]